MRRLLHITLLAALFIGIQGCATHAKFAQRYNSWIGKNIAYFIQVQGYPDRTFTLPNKHKVYVYEESRIVSYPSMGFGYGGYIGGGYGLFGYGTDIDQRVCKLFIETDSKGKIVKWGSRGNACVSE
jgi:hypothetical protein